MSQMKRSKLAVIDAAERLRAGESLESVAADAGITPHTLVDRLSHAGFTSTGGNRAAQQRSELKTYLASSLLRWYEPWMDEAECARVDPDLWFPDHGGSTREAKQICRGCEVVDECLAYAIENRERYGVYGGKSERERRQIAKEREVAA